MLSSSNNHFDLISIYKNMTKCLSAYELKKAKNRAKTRYNFQKVCVCVCARLGGEGEGERGYGGENYMINEII